MSERIGRQDPTTAFILPYSETDGDLAVKLYEMTGRAVLEWQRAMIYDILARNENKLWVHTKFGYSVPRRNGKGEILLIRELYGLAIGERILHTAHRTQTSHSAWERLCNALDSIGAEYKAIRAKGQEYIELENGGKVEFRTRTSKGGLGEGFDLLAVDEAQEYQDDQESTLKYVVTDSSNPQTLMCGTPPTPISSGTVFKKFRDSVLSGEGRNSGWSEWSVNEMTDINDIDAWYETNPSLGLTLTERAVSDEIGGTEEDKVDLNIQRLGLWTSYNLQSIISKNAWAAIEVGKLPKLTGRLAVGIKYARDGSTVSVAIAGRTGDEKIFFEVVDHESVRDGTDRIVTFLKRLGKNAGKIVIDGVNGQNILKNDMRDSGIKKDPILPTAKEVAEASQQFETSIYQKTICHMKQNSLDAVATNCIHRAIGSGGGFGYKASVSEMDISLMESVILAIWAVDKEKTKKQIINY